MRVLTRRFRLRGVHYLYDPNHAEPKHGHEYFLQVSVQAEIGREVLEDRVEKAILQPWDKQDWNAKGVQQASGELLVEEFDRILRGTDLAPHLIAVALKETRKNRFISSQSSLAHGE